MNLSLYLSLSNLSSKASIGLIFLNKTNDASDNHLLITSTNYLLVGPKNFDLLPLYVTIADLFYIFLSLVNLVSVTLALNLNLIFG